MFEHVATRFSPSTNKTCHLSVWKLIHSLSSAIKQNKKLLHMKSYIFTCLFIGVFTSIGKQQCGRSAAVCVCCAQVSSAGSIFVELAWLIVVFWRCKIWQQQNIRVYRNSCQPQLMLTKRTQLRAISLYLFHWISAN